MHGKNNKPYRQSFHNPPIYLNDPLLQQVTMMALLSRPGIEKQLEEAINIIEGINSTIRTMRRGMESFHVSMMEAQRHMRSLPGGPAYRQPNKEKVQHQSYNTANIDEQSQFNKFSTYPLNNSNSNPQNNK